MSRAGTLRRSVLRPEADSDLTGGQHAPGKGRAASCRRRSFGNWKWRRASRRWRPADGRLIWHIAGWSCEPFVLRTLSNSYVKS
jgi:hypothetical protein